MADSSNNNVELPGGITRRDFVNSLLVGTGAALCSAPAPLGARAGAGEMLPEPDLGSDWYGYGGVGDYADSHGNTPEVVYRAHSLRDRHHDWSSTEIIDAGETYELAIVGGGMAGLGAALKFTQTRKDGERLLLLDNHPVFGGEAKRNEFEVDGYRLAAPQGANGFSIPKLALGEYAVGDARYFEELGIERNYEYPELTTDPANLRFAQDDYECTYWNERKVSMGYFFDEKSHGVSPRWVKDGWLHDLNGFPISEKLRAHLVKWRDWSQRPYSGDDFGKWLDGMSYQDFVMQHLGLDKGVASYADPILANAAGGCSSAISAYSAYAIGMPGVKTFYDDFSDAARHQFPGGNDGFARYFVKAIMPEALEGDASFAGIINGGIRFDQLDRADAPTRMRLSATVLRVEHIGEPGQSDQVRIVYARDRRLYSVTANAVVMATGAWITKYLVRDLPTAHRQAMHEFVHTAVLVANVAVRNWRFLYDLGFTGFRWWADFGFACALKRPMHVGDYRPPFHPDQPAVLSFYVPLYYPDRSAAIQGVLGRNEILGTSFAAYETKIRKLMMRLFGNHGFDAARDIAGIILNRWGHAYLLPTPGFYLGRNDQPAARDIIRIPFGRIAFAHSELYGNQHWGPAAAEGSRAVEQLQRMI